MKKTLLYFGVISLIYGLFHFSRSLLNQSFDSFDNLFSTTNRHATSWILIGIFIIFKGLPDRIKKTISILLVFSITGSLSLWVAGPILDFFGLDKSAISAWIFWPIRISIIFPIYQILIVLVGALFGQFEFFCNFEKKMLARLGFKHFKQS